MSVYTEQHGRGPHLVLLHGWGMNGAVWRELATRLEGDFCLHIVDLPGFGHSPALAAGATLADWADSVLAAVPERAAWLGWSLGGLVATQAALQAPTRVSALITLASSPRFVSEAGWPGIKPEVLSGFEQQLAEDHHQVVNRFLALQAMGSEHARDDIRRLRDSLASKPAPDPGALAAGLGLLGEVDLRTRLADLGMPLLRLYGRLDGLVPRKAAALTDDLAPASHSHMEPKASHAPFISHPDATAEQIRRFLHGPR
ncbi:MULTISPECIES: pimeloyl-ACP methyl ester esterase BioH [Oceanimonas]|uniref:Pimeloyl-[acyl-carrier protein] methyl ester esterase n=1 Tax=Oceanimonas doudoroffii TaxID=84158 RepID=A0A233RDA9_9GAMM|nr:MULTISPECIES: pimeloyl-ACP methyl ester esterase BioH [Oceanimonas]NHH99400.1 Pimeloyl-[acyl-carrier protein] methyl ester esterase [Oceanimonas sp. MB9]OXY81352.1 pimeloyl-[acyl-carrier protein] methyl ester esterase [Oceanimonas doudoroffii]